MATTHILVITLYSVALVWWASLAAVQWRRRDAWQFTPRWHGYGVPLFRAFFLLSLPVEYSRGQHQFDGGVFVIAGAATVGWLAVRTAYLARRPAPRAAAESVRYNLFVTANLLAFGLAMHSFVCLSVAVNISIPALVLRYHWLMAASTPPNEQPTEAS